jgi:hypothetical protein
MAMVIGSNAVPAAITQVDARTGCKFTAPEAFLIYAEYFIYIDRHAGRRAPLRVPPIAVPQLLYPETTALKWHFPQENATLHDARKGT